MIDMFAFGRSANSVGDGVSHCELAWAQLGRQRTGHALEGPSHARRVGTPSSVRGDRERLAGSDRAGCAHLATCIDRVGQVGRRQDTGAVAPASFAHCSNAQLTLEREREVHGVMAMLIAGFAQSGGRPLGTERV
jgi:hypothetical protein